MTPQQRVVFSHDTVDFPAFKSFSYRKPWVTKAPGKPEFGIILSSDSKRRVPATPPADYVRIARALFEPRMADLVLTALWDEFNDRGPVSGMWWRGSLKQIRATAKAAGLRTLAGPDDLKRLMRLTEVMVAPFIDGSEEPVAQLCFVAAFEPEHGVAVLTDGQKILGTGYTMDVQPYQSPRRKRPGGKRKTRK